METTLTRKGQVTIPKHIRDSLKLESGCRLIFDLYEDGEVGLRRPKYFHELRPDRVDRAFGASEIKMGCTTDEYMEFLRGYSDDPA
jgi:AbrB family looped-hinge helix DNA binding protein